MVCHASRGAQKRRGIIPARRREASGFEARSARPRVATSFNAASAQVSPEYDFHRRLAAAHFYAGKVPPNFHRHTFIHRRTLWLKSAKIPLDRPVGRAYLARPVAVLKGTATGAERGGRMRRRAVQRAEAERFVFALTTAPRPKGRLGSGRQTRPSARIKTGGTRRN